MHLPQLRGPEALPALQAFLESYMHGTSLRSAHHPMQSQLVRQLDSGVALDVAGIPDAFLRSRLLTLFDNLVQLRKNSAVGGAGLPLGAGQGSIPHCT